MVGGWSKTKLMLFSTQVEVVVEWKLELSLAIIIFDGNGLLRLKKTIPMILLHLMTTLTKLFYVLLVSL